MDLRFYAYQSADMFRTYVLGSFKLSEDGDCRRWAHRTENRKGQKCNVFKIIYLLPIQSGLCKIKVRVEKFERSLTDDTFHLWNVLRNCCRFNPVFGDFSCKYSETMLIDLPPMPPSPPTRNTWKNELANGFMPSEQLCIKVFSDKRHP